MNAERYLQIEELFHAALERKAEERPDFIDLACGEDEELRREVKSLMAYDDRASHFIEGPPAEVAAALLSDEREQSNLGRTLGHYQILSQLGTGGMGEVYLAEDTKLGRKVALKLLPPESVADERAKKRLIREAQAAAKLDHPNICAIHEVCEENDQTFIVMQYVEGEPLSDYIRRKPLEMREVLDIAVQVADALREAHTVGITHRDIKPENIMITSRERPKVMDFGLAILAPEQTSTSGAKTESVFTEPGMIIGTVPYMSPEQVKGESIDNRSDIFSFGAVLYQIITGRQPFAAASTAETISAILTQEPQPLLQYADDVPEELQRIVLKCLEKDKDWRYQSTSELLVDLRSLKSDSDSGASLPRAVLKPRGRQKWIYFTALLAIISMGAIAFFLLYERSKPTVKQIRSLAILPFVNADANPNAEYLCDGIAESLINSLSQLSQLKVIARTTAFRYKGADADVQTIGRELRVDAIITGKVTQQGDAVLVQADLLSTADGTELWGSRRRRKLSDIFAVQEQITTEIAENLRFTLTGDEKQVLSRHYTENIKAYKNYLLGLNYLQRRTRQDFLSAIDYFEKAIEEEPTYALAYAALTEAYVSLTIRGLIEPVEGRRRAGDAATKAISLDPSLAEAHAAVGEIHVHFAPFDFSAGDRELRRAIELSANQAIARQVLAGSLLEQGRIDESLEEFQRARELDPLSPLIARMLAYGYLLKRDYPRAIELFRQSYDLGPPFIVWGEIEFYIQAGNLVDALAELERARQQRSDDPLLVYSEGMVYAAQGKRADALLIIEELEHMPSLGLSPASWIARIYAKMNEKESGLEWLERGLEGGAIPHFFKDSPIWDPFRNERRFRDLLRRMGIPS